MFNETIPLANENKIKKVLHRQLVCFCHMLSACDVESNSNHDQECLGHNFNN